MGNGQWASDRYLYVANIYGFHISLPSFSCSYHLFGVECQAIEDWIPKWRSCFEKLDSSAGYMSDSSKIQISYNPSLFDYLEIWKKNYQE